MARIETIGYNPGNPADKTEVINVSGTVGLGGVNLKEDVIVVQALLKYALQPRIDFRDADFPEPCGAFIKTTAQLIKKYQRFNNRKHVIRVPIDGRIDPMKGGAYVHGKRKFWTLYSLHLDALETALLSGDISPIEGVCKRWPFIREILNNGVGTLNLGLE